MGEREPTPGNDDHYWTDDRSIGEAPIGRERSAVRLRLYVSEEPDHLREALYPLAHHPGRRTCVHAQSYVLAPAIALPVGLYPTPTEAGAIGEVTGAEWEGMRHQDIGNAQAWYHPADRVLILWECFLDEAVRQNDPLTDPVLATVWTGFEGVLLDRFPQTQRIATPSREDLYERPAWQQFLAGRGYQPFAPGCFVKEVAGEGPSLARVARGGPRRRPDRRAGHPDAGRERAGLRPRRMAGRRPQPGQRRIGVVRFRYGAGRVRLGLSRARCLLEGTSRMASVRRGRPHRASSPRNGRRGP
jgi:hypothetical protein